MKRKINFFGFFLFLVFLFLRWPEKVLAAFSFEIKSVQPNLVSSKSQEVEVILDVKDLPSESYFRVGWQEKEGDPYFGYIKNNNGDWVKIVPLSGDCSSYYRVSQTGDSQITLWIKIGEDTNLLSGNYLIRGHRFTLNCSATASTNTQGITVSLPDSTQTPTLTPKPTFTPTPTQILPTVTPTPANTPSPVSYSNIYISEFMAWPESGSEWVELYNDNDFEVDLYGWYLDDVEGSGSSPKWISDKISSKSYKIFYLDGAFLNNDGDDVRLLSNNQTQKDKKTFASSTKGKSWSKDSNGNWCEADPTPNVSNPTCLGPSSTPRPTSTPTPKLSLTPSPTPKLTVTPVPTIDLVEPEINLMTTENSGNSSVLGLHVSPASPIKNKNLLKVIPAIFIILGLVLLGISAFFFIKEKNSLPNKKGI